MNRLPRLRKTIFALMAAALMAFSAVQPAAAADKTFKVAWSIYAGYMPWAYAEKSGILKKWADKYGIKIGLVQINDYVESINQYTAGQFDAVADTTIDTLTIPSAGGVDSSLIILGDYTNGNDAIFIKGKNKTLADIKGQKVYLVQYSVSHYMLWLAMKQAGLKESDITTANIADADFVAAFGTPEVKALVAWNPATSQIRNMPDVSEVFDSSKLPGQIQDIVVANTATLKAHPEFGKALAGAWYEVLGIMQKNDKEGIDARTFMAAASGTNLADFDGQVKTTGFYYDPAKAVALLQSPAMVEIANDVQEFSFTHGLLGQKAKDKGFVGIELPGGKIVGDKANVKLRIDPTYMQLAAEGKL
ncbi:putative urea ABC transporter substrate-binding protein [Parvibaculum sp.]|uniref:putative urea ABC transporter substrate-binding protein n=1 Tax=Parvibaculum sp. TaxID=2024848 RepID=UPI00320E25D4